MSNEEKKHTQWLKTLFQKKGKKSNSVINYLGMLICIGVVMMILGNFFATNSPESPKTQTVFKSEAASEGVPAFGQKESASESLTMEDYEIHYENQLKETLEEVIGVSDVSVMVNLADTEKKVYEKDISTRQQFTDEADREGGTRKVEDITKDEQVVIVRSGDSEAPIVVKTKKPDIRGVLVVAKGVENMQVKTWVVEAVSRVLDVPTHRVSVLPKKTKGD